ncbi:PIN domain-like protein [Chiua virens]|nr:PIN domain-like protein [Chiua virens]
MGISGLLPLLKSIQVNKHLSEFSGQTLAVDAYVWLHRGVYACATELATGKKTTKYVDYAMHRVRLLRHHNIQPYVVFDGGPLPAKKETESERRQRREDNLAKANALASQGKHSQAREFYLKCVDVTPQMAYQLIKVLRAEGIQYVVAPYEADAQMAYLERIGIVDGIITEDFRPTCFWLPQSPLQAGFSFKHHHVDIQGRFRVRNNCRRRHIVTGMDRFAVSCHVNPQWL